MKVSRALALFIIGLVTASLFAAPAFAWLWPVFGFSGPGLGFPAFGTGPTISNASPAPQPGTPEWGFSIPTEAQPVLPGYPYYNGYPFHGAINFGPFGYGSPGLSTASGLDHPEGQIKT
jgi:hypothetical protein